MIGYTTDTITLALRIPSYRGKKAKEPRPDACIEHGFTILSAEDDMDHHFRE